MTQPRSGLLTRALARVALCFTVALPLALAGCLDYREQLEIKPDGSGTLQIDFVADLSVLGEVSKAIGEAPNEEDTKGPTREEILAGLQVEGIEVKELTVQQKDAKHRVRALIAFKDLAALGKIDGFGRDRRVDFYDDGDGKVRVVYSFDTADTIPIEELVEDAPPGQELDPIEKKLLAITRKARDGIQFRSRVSLPGPVLRSNGEPTPGAPNVSQWVVDKDRDPKRHAALGRGKVVMVLLVDRASVPFVKELMPTPPAGADDGTRMGDRPLPNGPARPGGLGLGE